MTIPRRRRAPTPSSDDGLLELTAEDPLQRPVVPELTLHAAERLGVGAPARIREIGLSEERIDRLDERRRLLPCGTQPAAGSPRRTHRRECVIFTGPGGDAGADERCGRRERCRGEWDIPRDTLRTDPDVLGQDSSQASAPGTLPHSSPAPAA